MKHYLLGMLIFSIKALIIQQNGPIANALDRLFIMGYQQQRGPFLTKFSDKGHIEMEGEPEAVMDYYNALLADKQNQSIKQVEHNLPLCSTCLMD
jgi:hypothetical protein